MDMYHNIIIFNIYRYIAFIHNFNTFSLCLNISFKDAVTGKEPSYMFSPTCIIMFLVFFFYLKPLSLDLY